MTSIEIKQCRRCGETKPVSQMKMDKRNGDHYSSFCKSCHSAASISWQVENRARVNETRRARYRKKRDEINAARKASYDPDAMRWERRRFLYKVTKEWYFETLEKQGGGCGICGSKQSDGSRAMHIDHDHNCCATTPTCGKCNRGVLCHKCNTSLHAVESSDDWISKAIRYLKG
jgi:hypothetical protein